MSKEFCTQCGTEIDTLDLFCRHCGMRIARTNEQVTREPEGYYHTRVNQAKHPLLRTSFFGVYAQGRTYLNLLYLLLLFPLGIFYFVYTVTLFSVSAGLLVTIFGIFLLYLFLVSLPFLLKAQGWLMEKLVGVKLPPQEPNLSTEGNFIKKAIGALKNKVILKAFAYFLFVAMPVGIIVFTVMVTLLSTSIGLIFSWVNLIVEYAVVGQIFSPSWSSPIFPMWIMVIIYICAPFIGVFLLTATLHLLNRLAILHGKFVAKLLEQ